MRRQFLSALALCAIVFSQSGAHASPGAGFATGTCQQPSDQITTGAGALHRVPADFPTIQAAVDASASGDTVLVSPGIYKESVTVRTPSLRIRGTNRATVILDGESKKNIGIGVFGVDRVQIENMTAHNYTKHGFFWVDLTGYRASYITSFDNGSYGIYAFDARCGEIDHSYGSGNADSAFYIGECFPCDAVIHDDIAEENALGYSGTNAGGNLILRDSVWRGNGLGIVPNSLDSEARPPQRGIIIKNNVIANNNGKNTPGAGIAGAYWGGGVVVAGGQNNIVYGNTITGHVLAGVSISPLPDSNVWISNGNTVWGNSISGPAGSYDIAQGASSGANNCYADNVHAGGGALTTAPMMLQDVWSCSLTATPPGGDPSVERALIEGQVPGPDGKPLNGRVHSPWQTWPAPNAYSQPNQPDDNGNGDYTDDGGVDAWLPALGY